MMKILWDFCLFFFSHSKLITKEISIFIVNRKMTNIMLNTIRPSTGAIIANIPLASQTIADFKRQSLIAVLCWIIKNSKPRF